MEARKPDPRCTCPRTVPHAGGEIRPQRRWGRRSKTASYAHGALGPVFERVTRRSWTRAARKQEKPTQGHLFGPWSQVGQFNVNTPTRSSSVSRRPTRIDKGSTGERTVQKWWPRGDSKPEKPTQGAPARAASTGKARLARRFAHESERRFGVYWAHRGTKERQTRRRNRFLNGCLRFLTPAPFPPHARSFTQPGQSYFGGGGWSPPLGWEVVTPAFDKITVQTMP